MIQPVQRADAQVPPRSLKIDAPQKLGVGRKSAPTKQWTLLIMDCDEGELVRVLGQCSWRFLVGVDINDCISSASVDSLTLGTYEGVSRWRIEREGQERGVLRADDDRCIGPGCPISGNLPRLVSEIECCGGFALRQDGGVFVRYFIVSLGLFLVTC